MKKLVMATAILMAAFVSGISTTHAQSGTTAPAPAPGVLTREQAAAILPPSVFFRGQSASIQARNSSGVRLAGGKLVLAAVVDTSGYSSGVAERYQAYLLTEVPLQLGSQTLPPGAYGFGFIEGDRMVLMDIGNNELLHATTTRDAALTRPTPLQIIAEGAGYRLYMGRSYVSFSVATK